MPAGGAGRSVLPAVAPPVVVELLLEPQAAASRTTAMPVAAVLS